MPKLPKKNYTNGGFDDNYKKEKGIFQKKTHFGNVCLTALCFRTLAWRIILQIVAHNAQFFSECEKSRSLECTLSDSLASV